MRMAREGWAFGIASGDTRRLGSTTLLFFCSVLDGAKDTSYFTLERRKLKVNNAATRMKNYIDRSIQSRQIVADGLTHTPFDAVAIDGLPHHLPHSESHARAGSVCIAQSCAIGTKLRTQNKKISHLLCELFTARLVHTLIVSVFAKTKDDSSRGHTAGPTSTGIKSRMTQFLA